MPYAVGNYCSTNNYTTIGQIHNNLNTMAGKVDHFKFCNNNNYVRHMYIYMCHERNRVHTQSSTTYNTMMNSMKEYFVQNVQYLPHQ